MVSNKQMELLAPAGDWDSLMAALAAGADAVYLGGQAFSARQYASNFDLEKIKEATELLHLHRRKVYIAVNTLINDTEMQAALNYLTDLSNIGVDAVIVQDLGLIKLAREYLPRLELHASTQMTCHNREGVLLLQDLGFQRVVLARELTADEIRSIISSSQVEIEVFVHGALCVCYSGRCLMSSMIGGRSGNRGRCAQPCRLEYQLFQGQNLVATKGQHLLSPKDLCLITEIPRLAEIGVTSLKIEGRMKRPEYVHTVVKTYRQALDRYLERPEDFSVTDNELKVLEQTFNRGFTTGYFGNKRNHEIMNFSRPNNRGILLGRVKQIVDSDKVRIRLETELELGDEIEIWISKGGRYAGPVTKMFANGNAISKAAAGDLIDLCLAERVYPGDRIFKVFSNKISQATKAAIDKANLGLKISCRVEVFGNEGEGLKVVYRDQLGNEGVAVSEVLLQPARNRPLTQEILTEQLGRLGNTPFYLQDLNMHLGQSLMLPVSELNQLRRRAIDALTKKRLGNLYQDQPAMKYPKLRALKRDDRPAVNQQPGKLSVWVGDIEGVFAAISAGADLIYVGGEEFTKFHWNPAFYSQAVAAAGDAKVKLIMAMPRINREGQKERWLPLLEVINQTRPDGIMVSDLGTFQLVLTNTDLPIYINYPLNIFNSFTLEFLTEISNRIIQCAVSPELTLAQIDGLKRLDQLELECLVHGPFELMVSEYCPIKTVIHPETECDRRCKEQRYQFQDRLDYQFPIYTDQFCRMHLFNSQELCLYAELSKLIGLTAVLRLDLRTYSTTDVSIITKAYRNAIEQLKAGAGVADCEAVITQFKNLSGRGITKGHYFRGVE